MTRHDLTAMADAIMVETLRWYVEREGGLVYAEFSNEKEWPIDQAEVNRIEECAERWLSLVRYPALGTEAEMEAARDEVDEMWAVMRRIGIPALLEESLARHPEMPGG